MSLKILIVDEMHPSLFKMLDSAGCIYDYCPTIDRSDILTKIIDYQGLIIRSKTKIDATFLASAPNLHFIARAGAGLDLIDTEAIKNTNIALFSANEGNKDAVGEHAVGMLLSLMANIAKADREVRKGIWNREDNRGYELMGKTVGLIGYGFNGKATAKCLSGFGCRILAYDKLLSNYTDSFVEETTMQEMYDNADILSLHIPLTAETRQMVDVDFIAKFKKPFYFINVSRGEIVRLEALQTALENGQIRGACLDVLENEKINSLNPSQQQVFDYLRNSNKVILTPHIAGWTYESYEKINEVLMKQILDYYLNASLRLK